MNCVASHGVQFYASSKADFINKFQIAHKECYETDYMLRFFEDKEQQAIIRESGVRLSIGFDGHRIEDYLPERVKEYNNRLSALGIKKIFE